MLDSLSLILDSTARLAAPLLFVALGELISERSGAVNISTEGMMLGGAFGAAVGASVSGMTAMGLVTGAAVGIAVAFLQAFLSHKMTLDQFVVGLTLNFLVLGLTSFLIQDMSLTPGTFAVVEIPVLSSIPIVGTALFAQPLPFYSLYLLVPAVWYLLWRSRWGLEIRSAGEAARASAVTGIDVNRRRRQAILLTGVLSGFGGAYLCLAVVGNFNNNMTSGRGYIALAAVIFGAWTVKGTVIGVLVFGAADALRLALPAIGYELNPQLLIAAPYVLALIAILVVAKRSTRPHELGEPYAPHLLR